MLLKGDFHTSRFGTVAAIYLLGAGDFNSLWGNASFTEQVAHGQSTLPCKCLVSASVTGRIVKT